MSGSFSLPTGFVVAEIETDNIYGTGGADFPTIMVTAKLLLRGPKAPGCCLDFRQLQCRVSPFDRTYFAVSLPTRLNIRIETEKELSNHTAYVQIPLDRRRLDTLNRLRNGADVKLRLDFELLADELVHVGRSRDAFNSPIWGLKEHYCMESRVHAEIFRSKWLEQVLPHMEFAKVHLVELPAVPIENCAEMKSAFDALQQAVKLESHGLYDEAVAKCRVALEPFFEVKDEFDQKGQKKQVPVLKSSWETRLGKATYDWLNASLRALKQGTNKAHHLSSSSYAQVEAQMLLIVTTAMVAYAIKTRPDPSS